jgi:hypothetical protein
VAFLFIISNTVTVTCNINSSQVYQASINAVLLTLWQQQKQGNILIVNNR